MTPNFYTGFDWDKVLYIILGEMEVEHFIANFVVMCAGALVYFTLDVNQSMTRQRVIKRKFSWGFLVRDNFPRMIGTLVTIMAAVIFYDSFFGVELNPKLSFIQGLSIDALIGMILKRGKQAGPLKKSREKLIDKYRT